ICYFGELICYFGELICYFGVRICYFGELICYFGVRICYFGELICYFGVRICYFGVRICYFGVSITHPTKETIRIETYAGHTCVYTVAPKRREALNLLPFQQQKFFRFPVLPGEG
ncbi:hypothetical protein, partial [Nostoc sp.]|uniref:hypothetical protein n=1 Tax=Nostoc sp. TaxID=1180 RepID=UPI002FFB5056